METTPPDSEGVIQINLAVAEASIQKRAVLYDKEGDAHFDTISAFIKSLRGSDPDAALYWLARMIYAGEDPRFIFRRMLILASEDVGLADPQAVVVVNACAQAFDRIGLPEGQYPLAQAALYLATTSKSNRVLGYFDALKAIEQEREAEVPNHLKDANRDREGFGHGAGYAYPHAYRDHWVAQQYLPTPLKGELFYQPSNEGYEGQIRDRIARQREAQFAVLSEGIGFTTEVLSFSPTEPAQERWLQRTLNQTGQQLAHLRQQLFAHTQIQRHHMVLDLQAADGLLTWEALRQTPEGGVYSRVATEEEINTLQNQAQVLPHLSRPVFLQGHLSQLQDILRQQAPQVKFDWIVGRNSLGQESDKGAIVQQLRDCLCPSGQIVLMERLPKDSQRLHQWLSDIQIDPKFYQRWQKAEEAIYAPETGDPLLNWDSLQWRKLFEEAGFEVRVEMIETVQEMYITPKLLERWFTKNQEHLSYGDRLRQTLSDKDVDRVKGLMQQHLSHQTVRWHSMNLLLITLGCRE